MVVSVTPAPHSHSCGEVCSREVGRGGYEPVVRRPSRCHCSVVWLRLIGAKHPHLPAISPQVRYDWLYAGDTHDRKFIRSLMTRPRTRRQPRARTDCGRERIKEMTMIDNRPAAPAWFLPLH